MSEPSETEEPESEIVAPSPGVRVVEPGSAAKSSAPVEEIEWLTAWEAVRDGVAMRREPVVENDPLLIAAAPPDAERETELAPETEKVFSPKMSELAEIPRVPAEVAGAARVLALLGFEKTMSEAFNAIVEPVVV